MDEARRTRTAALLVLLVFAAITAAVASKHEPWRDEADSWLLARDASVPQIFERSRNSGSPALWPLLLKPLARAGFPYETQAVVHLALAWAAAGILLLRSPFPFLTRILLLSSYSLIYEYAVIARSYVLTVLLLYIALAWRNRPWVAAAAIALLFNANVHGAVFATALGLMLALEWRKTGPALLMAGGAIAAAAQVLFARTSTEPIIRGLNLRVIPQSLAAAFAPGISIPWALCIAVALIAAMSFALRRQRNALGFLLLSLAGLMSINVLVWFGGYRHAGMLFVAAIGALWLAGSIPRPLLWILYLSLAISTVFAAQMAYADWQWNFSGSKEMGTFIRANDLDHLPIAAHNVYQTEAVLPYLDCAQFWYPATEATGSFTRLDRIETAGAKISYDEAVNRAIRRFGPSRQPWLLLLNIEMPHAQSLGFRPLYKTTGPVYRQRDERYWLYMYQPSI